MSSSSTCTSTRGPQGPAGQSQYTYIAYASDTVGTDFSLVPSNSLKYIQTIISSVPILTPTLSNFTGTWVKYIGDNGTSGTNGKNGTNGAISFVFNWSTVNNTSNPGAGFLKADDPDLSNASVICVSYEDIYGNDVSNAIDQIGTSSNPTKAILTLSFYGDSSKYASYQILSSPSSGGGSPGYWLLQSINYVSSSSTTPFVSGDDVVFSFSIVGDTGMPGSQGSEILYHNLTDTVSTGSGAWETLMSYTVPADTLETNGSYLKIKAQSIVGNPNTGNNDLEQVAVRINGNYFLMTFSFQYERMLTEIELYRESATDTKVTYKHYTLGGNNAVGGLIFWNSVTYTGTIPSTSNIDIELVAMDTVAAPQAVYIVAQQLLIEKTIN